MKSGGRQKEPEDEGKTKSRLWSQVTVLRVKELERRETENLQDRGFRGQRQRGAVGGVWGRPGTVSLGKSLSSRWIQGEMRTDRGRVKKLCLAGDSDWVGKD